MKSIYELELHENIDKSEFLQIIRVSGGWIYNFRQGGEVFVPYSNEFNQNKDRDGLDRFKGLGFTKEEVNKITDN